MCSSLYSFRLNYIVGVLEKYLSNPGNQHLTIIMHVLSYLKRIIDLLLTYEKSDSSEIIGYYDSNFAGCPNNKQSTSDYIFLLDEENVSQKFAKETLVASSTMAVEFMTHILDTNHATWI